MTSQRLSNFDELFFNKIWEFSEDFLTGKHRAHACSSNIFNCDVNTYVYNINNMLKLFWGRLALYASKGKLGRKMDDIFICLQNCGISPF